MFDLPIILLNVQRAWIKFENKIVNYISQILYISKNSFFLGSLPFSIYIAAF